MKAKRERNRTISGDSVKTQTTSKTLTQQVGNALSGITTALEQIKVNESKQNVTMPLPKKNRRAQSLPRGQVSNEESSFKVSLPGSARTSRQARYILLDHIHYIHYSVQQILYAYCNKVLSYTNIGA